MGVVLYEMLALHHPFGGTSNMVVLVKKIAEADPPRLPARYAEATHDMVRRILRKRPVERPGAEELLNLPVMLQCVRPLTAGKETSKTDTSAGSANLDSDDDSFTMTPAGGEDEALTD